MSRKILVEILVDWEGYEDISDELLLADIAESIEVQGVTLSLIKERGQTKQ